MAEVTLCQFLGHWLLEPSGPEEIQAAREDALWRRTKTPPSSPAELPPTAMCLSSWKRVFQLSSPRGYHVEQRPALPPAPKLSQNCRFWSKIKNWLFKKLLSIGVVCYMAINNWNMEGTGFKSWLPWSLTLGSHIFFLPGLQFPHLRSEALVCPQALVRTCNLSHAAIRTAE